MQSRSRQEQPKDEGVNGGRCVPRPRHPAPRLRLEELRPARPLSQAHSRGPREWQWGASREKAPRGAGPLRRRWGVPGPSSLATPTSVASVPALGGRVRVCLSPLPGGGIQSYSQLMWPKQTPVQTGAGLLSGGMGRSLSTCWRVRIL